MLDGIVDGFLGNAENMSGENVVLHVDRLVRANGASDAAGAFNRASQFLQGSGETAALQFRRKQPAGKISGLRERLDDKPSDLRRFVGLFRCFFPELSFKDLG